MQRKPRTKQTTDISNDVMSMLYSEFQNFREECREEFQEIREDAKAKNEIIQLHSETLLKLNLSLQGNGCKGLIERVNDLETCQSTFTKKFSDLDTKEKIKLATVGAVCATCSTLGGVLTYMISLYFNIRPHV
jgi:hypothetical protein